MPNAARQHGDDASGDGRPWHWQQGEHARASAERARETVHHNQLLLHRVHAMIGTGRRLLLASPRTTRRCLRGGIDADAPVIVGLRRSCVHLHGRQRKLSG